MSRAPDETTDRASWEPTGREFIRLVLRALPLVVDAVGDPPSRPCVQTWVEYLLHQIQGDIEGAPAGRYITGHITGTPRRETVDAMLEAIRTELEETTP